MPSVLERNEKVPKCFRGQDDALPPSHSAGSARRALTAPPQSPVWRLALCLPRGREEKPRGWNPSVGALNARTPNSHLCGHRGRPAGLRSPHGPSPLRAQTPPPGAEWPRGPSPSLRAPPLPARRPPSLSPAPLTERAACAAVPVRC